MSQSDEFIINSHGWLNGACILMPSPNFNQRPEGAVPSLLVIHNISLPPNEFGGGNIECFFTNQLDCNKHPYFETIRDLEVSAHCLISREGRLTQFVSFDDRAWHAGQSCFEGVENCNDFSIGIELEGSDHKAYTSKQYQSLAAITKLVMQRYPLITSDRIVGHSDIAPVRKTDPGPAFDWAKYRGLICT